jgi:hypothetical protein
MSRFGEKPETLWWWERGRKGSALTNSERRMVQYGLTGMIYMMAAVMVLQ